MAIQAILLGDGPVCGQLIARVRIVTQQTLIIRGRRILKGLVGRKDVTMIGIMATSLRASAVPRSAQLLIRIRVTGGAVLRMDIEQIIVVAQDAIDQNAEIGLRAYTASNIMSCVGEQGDAAGLGR